MGVGKEGGGGKFLRMRVTEKGKEIVTVNLPLALLNMAEKFIPEELSRFGVSLDEVVKLIKGEAGGRLVDITDEVRGVKVEVYID